jgi:hypothetical protein
MADAMRRERTKLRLDRGLPNWRWLLANDSEEWPRHWMQATGEKERNAYYMRDQADWVRDHEYGAILHLYKTGHLHPSVAAALLEDHVSDRVKEGIDRFGNTHEDWDVVLPDG